MNSESQVSGASALLRSAFGGLVFALSAKRKYKYVAALRLTSGEKMLCSLSSKEYNELLAMQFDHNRKIETGVYKEDEREQISTFKKVCSVLFRIVGIIFLFLLFAIAFTK